MILITRAFFFVLIFNALNSFSQNSLLKTITLQQPSEQLFSSRAIIDSDSNILICGQIVDTVAYDSYGFIAKFDSSLNIIWVKRYITGNSGLFYSIFLTDDGNYLLTGQHSGVSIPGSSNSILISKIDTSGNVLWASGFEGQDGWAINRASNGDFLIGGAAGRTLPNGGHTVMSLIRIDSFGNLLLNFSYSMDQDSTSERVFSFKEALDGGFIVTGAMSTIVVGQPSTAEMFLIKFDPLFNLQWAKSFNGFPGGHDLSVGRDVFPTPDSGFVVVGRTTLSTGYTVPMIMKVDKDGNFIWGKALENCGVFDPDILFNTIPYNNGFITFGTEHGTPPTFPRQFLLHSDSLGNSLFKKVFVMEQAYYLTQMHVLQTGDSDFVCIRNHSYGNKENYLLKTSLHPDPCTTIETTFCDSSFIPLQRDIIVTQETLFGFSSVVTTSQSVVMLDSILCNENFNSTIRIEQEKFNLDVFPNPTDAVLNVRLENTGLMTFAITDMDGRIVFSNNFVGDLVRIDLSGFNDGIYVLNLKGSGLRIANKKFIVAHN